MANINGILSKTIPAIVLKLTNVVLIIGFPSPGNLAIIYDCTNAPVTPKIIPTGAITPIGSSNDRPNFCI